MSISSAINDPFFTTSDFDLFTTGATVSKYKCPPERKWWVFLLTSLGTWAGGIILILLFRLINFLLEKYSGQYDIPGKEGQEVTIYYKVMGVWTRLKLLCEAIVCCENFMSKIVVSLASVLSIGSLIIYYYDLSRLPSYENGAVVTEYCLRWNDPRSPQSVDFAFNMYFLAFFICRFIAANDKLMFWMEVNSFVDYFTIPPMFVSIAFNRQWIGLRFLRALRFMVFPDILQYLSILRSPFYIRIAQIGFMLFAIWLTSAGFVHLVENSGDPFLDFSNSRKLSFFDACYFIMVTITTVGYGDITCSTYIGRLFTILFLATALAIFASYVPELGQLIAQRDPYRITYDKPVGARHIIVSGYLVYEMVKNFLKDFTHEDRSQQGIKCVFMDNKRPDLTMEALYKRNRARVVFLSGSIMNIGDLDRAQLGTAEACIILANVRSTDPYAEDMANILRVISIKNYCPNRRVIIQLLQFQNKSCCHNIIGWTSEDTVVCLTELKFNFLAQSCQAPGFSTLISNLYVMTSYKKSTYQKPWMELYFYGAGMEVYSSHFSETFFGLNFSEVAQLCFTRLHLLLFAVKVTKKKKVPTATLR